MDTDSATPGKEEGLAYWMGAALDLRRVVLQEATADAVHDLRVAIRRCRSMAEGMMDLDKPGPWRRMRREGRGLFRALGALRDTQVMLEWLERLAEPDDPVRRALETVLRQREAEETAKAQAALEEFRIGRWQKWARSLPARVERLELGGPVFAHLALERWREARMLHSTALRTGQLDAYHRLRVGIKRFRYTVENFLPARYKDWEKGLKEFQDLLGEVHDLDVLERLLPLAAEAYDETERSRWTARIREEQAKRLATYRRCSTGPKSRWDRWRKGLPERRGLAEAAMATLAAWAAFRDPDPAAARETAQRALEACEALRTQGFPFDGSRLPVRRLLEAAALLQNAAHPKRIAELSPPLGWTHRQMFLVGAVLRCAERRPTEKALASLSPIEREKVVYLSGLLRVAEAQTYREPPPA